MKFTKFGEIFNFQKKSHIKAGEGLASGEFPFFTSSQNLSKYLDSPQFNIHSLIFGTGGNASVHLSIVPFSTSTDCLVAQLNPESMEKFEIEFVYYFLLGNIQILEDGFKGSGLKHISKDYINNIDIPVLPIEKQREAIAVFDHNKSLRHKRQLTIELVDQYLKTVFVKMTGDLFINDKGWSFSNLGNNISVLTDYHANGSYEILKNNVELLSKPNYALMVRTTDLENNDFTKDVKYIDKHAYDFLEKSKVFGGEIIINKIGSAGKVYMMPRLDRPVSLGMNAFLLRFDKDVNPIFLYYLLTSEYGETIIKKRVQGAVTKTIRKDAIRGLQVPQIPLKLQNQFSEIVRNAEFAKQKMLAQALEIDNQFQSLMQMVFT